MSYYLFPFETVPKGSRIVLYGAGVVGKQFYNQATETNFCEIVLWLDKNADGVRVKSPQNISSLNADDYDFVVIAVENETVVRDVKDFLASYGISENKIIHRIIKQSIENDNYRNSKEILNTVKATHSGVLFAQAIQDCLWLKHKGFSFGDFGWAMDALSLHNLFRILEDVKPKNILEFGLGQSSKLVHQYAEYHNVTALTVEHDNSWIDYVKTNAPQISFNIRQIDLEDVMVNDVKTLSYKSSDLATFCDREAEYDFVIVDGPFGQPRYARPQVLDLIPNIGKDFCIFIHDSERQGEQETLALLYEKLSQSGIEFVKRDYCSVKNHTVVCSPSWKFLTSI